MIGPWPTSNFNPRRCVIGYTHYWYQKHGEVEPGRWETICEDFKKILEHTDVPLAWECDAPDKKIQIDDDVIRFNGIDEDGHETMLVERAMEARVDREPFAFCKTASKPYDMVVVALLCLMKHHAGDKYDISSDGDEGDWEEGMTLFKEALELEPMFAPEVTVG